jgi:hypothetical protein
MLRSSALGLGLALAVGATAASAQDNAPPTGASGHVALALAAIAGGYSTALTAAQKTVLTDLFTDKASNVRHAAKLVVSVKSITCRVSDVDIAYASCDLVFGAKTITITERAAHELLATLNEAGIQGEGAAGTIYYGLTTLRCTLSPSDVADNGGAGADCTFKASSDGS